jgi:hypothetical protein
VLGDYDEFIERELPHQATVSRGRSLKRWAWRAVIAIVCISLLRYLVVR